jgi:hypothetical protein
MDMSMDPYEIELYKIFLKFKNAQIGTRMKSWQLLQLGSVLQSDSNIQNVLDLDFFSFLAPKVTWWLGGEYWKDLGLVPNQFLWSSIFFM